jgi:hypothetical protein
VSTFSVSACLATGYVSLMRQGLQTLETP